MTSKYKTWKIPLGVGGFYDGKEVNYAIGPIVDANLPNPGNIEVIERAALDEEVERRKSAEEALKFYEQGVFYACDSTKAKEYFKKYEGKQ